MSAILPIKTLQFHNGGDLEERLSINAHNESASGGGGWVCFNKRGEGWVKLSKSGWTSMRVHKGGKGLTIRMYACFPLRYAWTATIRCYISQGKSKLQPIVQMSIDPIMIRPYGWWTCRVLMRHWKLWNRKSTLWTDAKNLHRTLCCARTFISEPPCFPFEGDLSLCTLLLSYFLQKLFESSYDHHDHPNHHICGWKPLLGALFRQAKTSRPREREADYAISEMLISDSSSSWFRFWRHYLAH